MNARREVAPRESPAALTVRSVARPECPACGSAGVLRHERLVDRWFGIAGEWAMRSCRSSECGVWYLDPVPHPDDIALLYHRYYTHGESGSRGDVLGTGMPRRVRLAYLDGGYGYRTGPASRAWLGWALALVPGRREHLDMTLLGLRAEWRGPLLDVGCGTGEMLRLMQLLGWDAEGLDPDPRAVALANESGLRARVGTLESAAVPVRHYAAVTSSHVIEHVPDPGRFLMDCLRATRPGGRLALVTPNIASLGHRLFGARWRGLEPPRHLQLFDVCSLGRLARAAGYQDVRVTTTPRLAAVIARETLRPEVAGLATAHQAGWPLRLFASSFQMVERAAQWWGAAQGEELFLTARAPGGAA